MNGRLFLYGMALPAMLAFATLAAIVMPNGDQLDWPRLISGFAAYLAVNIGGAAAGSRYARR
jgi:hypothetical protein